jgi:hypothetical protein
MPTPKKKPAPPNDQNRKDLLPRPYQGGSPVAAAERERIKQWTNWLQASDVAGQGRAGEAKRRQDGIKKFGEAYSAAMGTAQTYGGYKPKPKPAPTKVAKDNSGAGKGAGKAAGSAAKKNQIKSFGSVAGNSRGGGMNIAKDIIGLASSAGKTAAGAYAKGYNILGAGLPSKVVKTITQAGKGSTAGGFMQSAVKSKAKGSTAGSAAGSAAKSKAKGSVAGSVFGSAASSAAKKKSKPRMKTFG